MSVTSRLARPFGRPPGGEQSSRGTRLLALSGVALTLGAALQVMYHFIDVGQVVPVTFLTIVAVTLLAATVTARYVRPWLAVSVGLALLVAGLAWYLSTVRGNPSLVVLTADALSLLTGETLLRISNIHEWVLGVAPGPIFITWYFAVRRHYGAAVLAAGGTLGFFVLTGDADLITTVTGVVGATAALGFGDLERRGASVVSGEAVITVVAVMIIVPGLVSVVPATAGGLPIAEDFIGGSSTLEDNLNTADQRVEIQGSIDLSPEVRFSVTSTDEEYWRVSSYDRYTGDGWVRTGGERRYGGGLLDRPPGRSAVVTQTVRAEDDIATVPAAWRPLQLEGLDNVSVTDGGGFVPQGTLQEGESYRVRSAAPRPTPQELQSAGTDYPEEIEQRYTQLPSSTPDRVGERTSRLTANAETPYETARTVENWLENNREYSLDVAEPRGDVADAFLFEMERGYCTYYATTMVVMLRSEGIPARFVSGYSPGERVAKDRWVVRGQNAHAWVEVYFPDQGWVRFDPTPAGPRDAAREERVATARANNESNVDTFETTPEGEWTPEPTPTPEPLTPVEDAGETPTPTLDDAQNRPSLLDRQPGANGTATPAATPTPTAGNESERGADGPPLLPTRHQLGLGLLALVGLAAGARRSRLGERLYRAAWLRYQPPGGTPEERIERAYRRLAYHLEQSTYRPRRSGETAREWFRAVDPDAEAWRVLELRERARYAGEASEADADEAVSTVDGIVR